MNLVIVILGYLKYLSDTKHNFDGYTSNVVMVTTDLVRFPDNDNVGGPVIGSKAEVATTAASKGENDLEGSLQLITISACKIVKLSITITTIMITMVTKVIMIMIM